MGDLAEDTAVEGGGGSYRAKIVPDWDFLTPNGGYLSTIALRAAAAESELPRPASYYCHYLRPAASGETADLDVTTLRRSERTHSLRVTVSQQGRVVQEAMVLIVASPSDLNYRHARMPEVPGPTELRSSAEIHAPDAPPFRLAERFDQRPVTWQGRWDERPAMHPLWRSWYRLADRATFDDPFVEAGRALVLIDTTLWAAAALAFEGNYPFLAPSADLAVRFHEGAPHDPWVLTSTESPVGVDGLMGGYAALWASDGRLLATGGQQMFHLGDHPGGADGG